MGGVAKLQMLQMLQMLWCNIYSLCASFVWVLNPAPRLELEPPAWGRLREIAVPTLIVVGGDDSFLLHRYADQLEREIAAAKRVTISGTHHMPNMEKPEEFNRVVLDFLKTL